jgi:hypothetical protein
MINTSNDTFKIVLRCVRSTGVKKYDSQPSKNIFRNAGKITTEKTESYLDIIR